MSGRVSADGAVVGARVRTLDPRRPEASAVAWRDGTVVAVGDDGAVRAACDGRTEVVDAGGACLVPGLTDGHFHPLKGVDWTAGGVDLMACRTLDETRAALVRRRAEVGEGGWVTGYGLPYAVFPGGQVDGSLLADAVGGAPAYLDLYDGHAAVVTPKALELAGVTGPRPLPGSSEVVCRDGVPTGELRESPAQELVRALLPEPSAEQRYARQVAAFREWAALGLTGVHAMDGDSAALALLRDLEERGDLPMRVRVALTVAPEMSRDELDELLRLRDEHGRLWRCGAAKFFVDGTVDAGTSWLFEPDSCGEGVQPYWQEPQAYADAVALFAGAGFQCATHAIGDRGIQAALDAYRAVTSPGGVPHRIEHIETLRDEELARFAAERVVASMQPVHADMSFDGTDPTWPARLGPERSGRGWRYGDLRRAGAVVALGSDWPIAPADPRVGMASARLRRPPWSPDAEPYGPEQAFGALEALEGFTVECARAVGEGEDAGVVRPGCRADLTGFAADPVRVGPTELLDVPVTLTVVDGHVVHRA